MARTSTQPDDPRDASLRVSKHVRDSLKAAAAVMSRPLYAKLKAARSECDAAS
jgi:hypothetical protein